MTILFGGLVGSYYTRAQMRKLCNLHAGNYSVTVREITTKYIRIIIARTCWIDFKKDTLGWKLSAIKRDL